MKNILILNAGTRNTLIQNFLETIDGRCQVITTDNFELAPALYEVPKHYITKKWYEEGYWEDIEDICINEDIGLVLSLIDSELELLAKRKQIFDKMGILVNISSENVIKTAFDKYKTFEFLKKNNYNFIKSYIDYNDAADDIADGILSFPLITKPRKGSGSAGIEIVYNLERLKQICDLNNDILIQEFINGQEIGADVYVDLISGEVTSIFTKKKLKMRAGETDKSVSFKDNVLFQLIAAFAKDFGLKGVNDIDVFEKEGKYYISEVNPRFGGGYIHAYAAGVNFPGFLVNNMNGVVNSPDIGNYEKDNYMMKYFAIKILGKDELH
ncbi:MAG: ATP-grasp domain-containing protein [Lachnospiraceae bacterium]|nr:ATP-grasp domain-containing protein [Lachnospiraceae bacterium]